MLAYSTLANPELLQESPASKLFRLTKFWVHKIEFPAHHKKLVKNKKTVYISKKLDLIFQGEKLLWIATTNPTRHCHTPKAEHFHRINIRPHRSEREKFT